MKQISQRIIAVIILLISTSVVNAQGLRYASIKYRIVAETDTTFQVRFYLNMEWDMTSSLFAGKNVGDSATIPPFNFGDGTIKSIHLGINRIEDGIAKGRLDLLHTYSKANAPYTSSTISQRRTNQLTDGNASSFYVLQTTVINAGLFYDSPSINTSPVTTLQQGQAGQLTLFTGLDEGADPSSTLFFIPGFHQSGLTPQSPSFVTSLSASGQVMYNVPITQTPGYYAVQVRIQDNRGGTAVVDYMFRVIPPCNPTPSFVSPPTPVNGVEDVYGLGVTITYTIEATSSDPNLQTKIITTVLPVGATLTPVTLGQTSTYTFSWTPTAAQLGIEVVAFIASNFNLLGGVACEGEANTVVRIKVVDPNCQVSAVGVISYTQPANFAATYLGLDSAKYYTGVTNSVELSLANLTGSGNYDYMWSNGTSASTLTVSSALPAQYSVMIIDKNEPNCSTIVNFTIIAGQFAPPCDPVLVIASINDISTGNGTCGAQTLTYYHGVTGPITLCAIASGLTPPLSYIWSNGATTQNITVTPSQNTTYTCIISETYGECSATASTEVVYCDARAYDNNGQVDNKKVTICHYPSGNPSNFQTLTINIHALCAHIVQHNDRIGDCNCGPTTAKTEGNLNYEDFTALNVYPNPSNGQFNLDYNMPESGEVALTLTDLMGRVILTKSFHSEEGHSHHAMNLEGNPAGVYLLKVAMNADEYMLKVNIVK